MDTQELEKIAGRIVADGKGILAADESTGTIKKRFDSIGCDSTEDRRRAYREMLFTTEGAAQYVSGVILFDETIRQSASDGRALVKVLQDDGVIPGIKVDAGTKPLAGAPDPVQLRIGLGTQGAADLESLSARHMPMHENEGGALGPCQAYRRLAIGHRQHTVALRT